MEQRALPVDGRLSLIAEVPRFTDCRPRHPLEEGGKADKAVTGRSTYGAFQLLLRS